MSRDPVEVTLLTQQHCAFCDEAREVLARLADEYPIAVVTRDIASPAGQEMAVRGSIMFPPGIFIDGEPFSYGRPSERKLRRALGRRIDA